ncbi:MAG TPA: single-stranded DNA-binding protein [Pyrinomonadaceae bacterium]|jgi:single-strand DNA-binding protein|nr:single-stranded DNA-binding protein [Pyrinomonadaceae bacterium]
MSFNKITIVGNLGRDPEMRYTPQGTPVCTFSIATNERRKDRAGELQDITTWFRVTAWGKQAETASKYLTKGRRVYVEGRLHVEEWTDKEGKPRHTLEVNASDLQFIDSAGGEREGEGGGGGGGRSYDQPRGQGAGGQGGAARGAAAQPSSGADIEDDDIPF